MKPIKLTLPEIEQYWGSLEEYQEEQRRTGLWELEARSAYLLENNLPSSYFSSGREARLSGRRYFFTPLLSPGVK